MTRLSAWWSMAKDSFVAWNQDNVPRLAAALAFYCTLSLAPLLLIVISVAAMVFGAEAARGEILEQLESTMGATAASAVQDMLNDAAQTNGSLWACLMGIGLLLFGATGTFVQLQDALNAIWKVPPRTDQAWLAMIRDRFLSFSMIVGSGFLLLVSLVINSVLEVLADLVSTWPIPGGVMVWQAVHFGVSILVMALLFAMIFKVLPDVEIRWRDVTVGAVMTALLFTLGKWAIGLYLARGSVASAYGAAGTFVILLLWVYYSSLLVLFGAEFTRVYSDRQSHPALPATLAANDLAIRQPDSQKRELTALATTRIER